MTVSPLSEAALLSFAEYIYTEGVNASTNWFIDTDCKYIQTLIAYSLSLHFLVYGGAISRVSEDATSYENRNAFISFQFYSSSGSSPYPSDGISFVSGLLRSVDPNPHEACALCFLLLKHIH